MNPEGARRGAPFADVVRFIKLIVLGVAVDRVADLEASFGGKGTNASAELMSAEWAGIRQNCANLLLVDPADIVGHTRATQHDAREAA